MEFRPNQKYFRMRLKLLRNEHITIICKKETIFYRLDEDLEIPEFFLTEAQFNEKRDNLIHYHMVAALRRYYANRELGHEQMEFDEYGNEKQDSWTWVPGYLDPSEFNVMTVPYYVKKVDYFETNGSGELHQVNA